MNKKILVLVIAGLLIIVLLYKLFAPGESADDMSWRGFSLENSSPDKAFIWFHNAAEKYLKSAKWGNADAQFKLGECYRLNRGVNCGLGDKFVFMRSSKENRFEEAAKWFTKAAEKGHAGAQCALGLLYMQGLGVMQDKTEAVKWVRKAAEKGYDKAQYDLGECYSRGEGVAENKIEALKWYRKAAEQGYADAQYAIAECYYNGVGVVKDNIEAKKWYQKVVEKNLFSAITIKSEKALYVLEKEATTADKPVEKSTRPEITDSMAIKALTEYQRDNYNKMSDEEKSAFIKRRKEIVGTWSDAEINKLVEVKQQTDSTKVNSVEIPKPVENKPTDSAPPTQSFRERQLQNLRDISNRASKVTQGSDEYKELKVVE